MSQYFGLLLVGIPFLVQAQNAEPDTLALRWLGFSRAVAQADTLSLDEVMEGEWSINRRLGDALIGVLEAPGLSDGTIDSLFATGPFRQVRSSDDRLRIFNWDERTGGTFQAQVSVVCARLPNGLVKASYHTASDDEWCVGAGYSAIHRLRTTNGSALYACLGDVRGCSTCCAEVITVLEITPDGLNFTFPAFPSATREGEEANTANEHSSTWALDARCGDITHFDFDPRKQELRYTYVPDDLTPVPANATGSPVSGRWRFNGETFVVQ